MEKPNINTVAVQTIDNPQQGNAENFSKTENAKIHHKFCALGRDHKKIVNELLVMLPEIQRLEIYKQYNCKSVHEYACKYAGLSYPVVEKELWTDKKLENAPKLKAAIKEVGIHKVALFATIVTIENDEALTDKVTHMSKSALVQLSKELRGNVFKKMSVELDTEMQFLFEKIKKELGCESDEETLKTILQQFANEETLKVIPQKSSDEQTSKAISQQSPNSNKNILGDEKQTSEKAATKAAKRYIPVQQKRAAIAKTNGKCAYPNCTKPYENLHHPQYFAHVKNHENLVPLCKIHHEYAHNGLIENQSKSPQEWKFKINAPINYYDQQYRKVRQG